MWYAFWSVVHDLWLFAIGDHITPLTSVIVITATLPSAPTRLQLNQGVLLNIPVNTKKSPVLATVSQIKLPEITPDVLVTTNPSVTLTHSRLNEPSIMYVTALIGTVCLRELGGLFDVSIATLPFGTAVTVTGFSGRYAYIQKGSYTGWIMKDDLTPHKHEVWPELVTWGMYAADNDVTIKIRALINDEFGAGSLALPLQAGEYVLLRLLQENRKIIWPDDRPRIPGSWQTLLKGSLGIHNSITPKTDTIMEWQTESDGGRVAYVEAVGLDGVITTSCVGLVVAGQYTKQVWGQADWKELRPTFIEVS